MRLRLVWDVSNPRELRWRNEMSVAGGPFGLVEEYRMTPVGAA